MGLSSVSVIYGCITNHPKLTHDSGVRNVGEVAQLGLRIYHGLPHTSGALVRAAAWGISVVLHVASLSPEASIILQSSWSLLTRQQAPKREKWKVLCLLSSSPEVTQQHKSTKQDTGMPRLMGRGSSLHPLRAGPVKSSCGRE